MKRSKPIAVRFLSLFLLGILLSGCQGKSPRGVAENYLEAFHDQDYEKAKKYATDDTKRLLDMFISLAAITPDSLKTKLHFEVLGERIKGDTAYVEYRLEGSRKTQSLTLLKADGNWKVAATKDSLNEIEGGEAIDSGAIQSDTSDAVPGPTDSVPELMNR